MTLERAASSAPEEGQPRAAEPKPPALQQPVSSPLPAAEAPPSAAAEPAKPVQRQREVQLILNGTPLVLPEKDSGQPYYLMDLLERSGLDFDHLEGPVRLTVNGAESGFSQSVRSGDVVTIRCD